MKSPAKGIVIAVAAVAGGAIARHEFAPVVSPDALLVFVFSVILAARFGGLVGGLTATGLSMIVGDYFFVEPLHTLGLPGIRETLRFAFFFVEGSTIAVLFHYVERNAAAERTARNHLRQFLAVTSHELRNPLGAITTSAEILAAKNADARASAVLMRQVQHLARMVADISDLARLERAQLEIRRTVASVTRIAEAAADTARPEFRMRDQTFELIKPTEDPRVFADPARIQQVLANLLLNASRYTPTGGHIDMIIRCPGPHVIVRVKDDGQGFEPSDIGRLFQPFERGGSDQPGTGLGLAISKALIERHGGTIEGYSAGRGCGATFTVTLPTTMAGELDAPPADEAGQARIA